MRTPSVRRLHPKLSIPHRGALDLLAYANQHHALENSTYGRPACHVLGHVASCSGSRCLL